MCVWISACERLTVCGAPPSLIQPPSWLLVLNANSLFLQLCQEKKRKYGLYLMFQCQQIYCCFSSSSTLAASLGKALRKRTVRCADFLKSLPYWLFCHRHITLQVSALLVQPSSQLLLLPCIPSHFALQLSPPLLVLSPALSLSLSLQSSRILELYRCSQGCVTRSCSVPFILPRLFIHCDYTCDFLVLQINIPYINIPYMNIYIHSSDQMF